MSAAEAWLDYRGTDAWKEGSGDDDTDFVAGAAWQASRPVSEAELRAALTAWWTCKAEGPGAQGVAMLAALEAARAVSS